ncbi:glycosyltransferase family 87 protein [Nocardioides xinjiangensis]|uniref:glycosyltransferase family 87 protein n=1 Tax=Nocardioides xinjiangensis TaxID=2817376 RepID=UPI001B3135E3|nr:glycosyltransferase family 87 protein [Nocardioides sp. SYSU D00514]
MANIDLRTSLPLHVTWMLGLTMVWITWTMSASGPPGIDSHAYWSAWTGDSMYDRAPGTLDAYLYSPAFAQLMWPLVHLPWPAFGVLWAIATVAGLVYLFAPMGWRWVPPMLMLCSPEIASGNIFWLLAIAAVLGLRHPSVWAFVLLTKVTPALGPIWFAVRREWRNLAVSAASTVAAIAVSYALAPDLWAQWLAFLADHTSSTDTRVGAPIFPPLIIRLPVALVLLLVTARMDKRWGLPVAMICATPVSGIAAFTMLAALPRLLLAERTEPRGTSSAQQPAQDVSL